MDGRRPASWCAFSCPAVIVDPPQSAEIERFDEEDLAAAAAAAAMSIVLLDVEALALEAALVRLGAMAFVRSVRDVLRAGKKGARGRREIWGRKGQVRFWSLPFAIIRG